MKQITLTGFGDEISPKLSEQMDTMQQLGIRHIEARGVDGVNISDLSLRTAREVKTRLSERGFSFSALGSPIGKIKLSDDFATHLEKLRHTIELAQELQVKYIRMFSFYMEENADPADCRGEVIDRLGRMIETVKGSGVILLHENEKGIYGDTVERCADLMETLGSPDFRMTFDPANFVQCGQTTFPTAFERLAPYVEYIHIKDAVMADGKVVPAGAGDGQVREVLGGFLKRGYRGFVSLEPHLGSFEGLSSFEKHMDIDSLPKGGAGLFTVAYNALCRILDDLGDGASE